MTYPRLPKHLLKESLAAHFTLEIDDRTVIERMRTPKNRLGGAVLLKTFQFLGYPPRQKPDIPPQIVEWIANQLKIDPSLFHEFRWKDRAFRHQLAMIREHMEIRPFGANDQETVAEWLFKQGNELTTRKEFVEAAVSKCRELKIELPTEKGLRRITDASRRRFLENLYEKVAVRLDQQTRKALDDCITASGSETARFDWMKTPPGKTGLKTIFLEIEKIEFVRAFGIKRDTHLINISDDLLEFLADRARVEDASLIRRHPPAVRYTLLCALLHVRGTEVTDNILRTFLQLVRRVEKKADKSMEREIVKEIKKVYGKRRILFKVAKAVTTSPDGIVREVVFPVVGESVFKRLVDELGEIETRYDLTRTRTMKKKYGVHYRRMMKPILDTLVFRANNPAYQPVIKGLELVHRHLDSRHFYYPETEEIPDGLLKGKWKELGIEEGSSGPRIVKQYFELCVLQKLERGLKCKEVWVEGAFRYRNPDRDMPQDWQHSGVEYCQKSGIPADPREFIEPIRKEMVSGLEAADRYLSKKQEVYIYYPGGGDRGLLRIPKIEKRQERPILQEIKNSVLERWGILDLLDILIEVDRQINFLRFFRTVGQRQVISPDEARERLLLSLFSLGTNTELKRIHAAASPACSYTDLLYFRKRFVRTAHVREAIAALTNRILEVRNPRIWGKVTTCASDARHMGVWNQNLLAEFNPHYNRTGVMAYWHVEKNALCIYSQLSTCGASQVAPMIEGLVRHDTEMRVETNFVDSHGQSEVAYPFCRFLGIDLIPRLKRVKYERLYLPEKDSEDRFPNLAGILARPIRWDLPYEQYNEMAKHVVAVAERFGPTESILWRFNSYNRSNPVYKAFIELGKAQKTINLCREIVSPVLREERHEALNVIENFNSANDFVCYGRQGEIHTNDPEMQELTVICLHLLQNAIILANTIMVERVLEQKGFLGKMQKEDFRALTPLFTSNINPYGIFTLDFEKKSFLDAA